MAALVALLQPLGQTILILVAALLAAGVIPPLAVRLVAMPSSAVLGAEAAVAAMPGRFKTGALVAGHTWRAALTALLLALLTVQMALIR
jgi:hypothetical protein